MSAVPGDLRRHDPTGQLDDVLGLAEHLRDALWRVESAGLRKPDAPGTLMVAGMGGSAIGAMLARAALGDRLRAPLHVVRGPALPGWTTPGATVLCSSYSGDTEETLAAFHDAGRRGAARLVATTGGALAAAARAERVPVIPLPGGFRPRHAVGYGLVVALEVAALCGIAPGVRDEVEAAAALAAELAAEWGAGGLAGTPPGALARDLHGTVPVIVGVGLTAPVAYRFKTQINENAKAPAFAGVLPEFDHNEIAAWGSAHGLGPFSAVLLDDIALAERARRRVELTAELIAPGAVHVRSLQGQGETPTERLVSLVLLADVASLHLAALRGVDPQPLETVDRLKARLAG